MSNEQKLREALRELMSIVSIHQNATRNNFAWAEMDFAREALATTEPEPAGMPKLPEPDSYEFQHEETGNTMFVDRQQVEWGFEKNNPRLQKIAGAYTTSQMRAYGEQCWKAGYKHGAWGDKPAVNQQLTTEPVDER